MDDKMKNFTTELEPIKKNPMALAGVAQLVRESPHTLKGGRFDPQLGCVWKATDGC